MISSALCCLGSTTVDDANKHISWWYLRALIREIERESALPFVYLIMDRSGCFHVSTYCVQLCLWQLTTNGRIRMRIESGSYVQWEEYYWS
jgi:hypothetical protein